MQSLQEGYGVPRKQVPARGELILDAPNGHGSTATKIRRFSVIRKLVGCDFNLIQSSVNGDSVQILTPGIYAVRYQDGSSSTAKVAITVNDTALTTDANTPLTYAQGLRALTTSASNSTTIACSWVGFLSANDVVRAHDNGDNDVSDSNGLFSIVRISS